MNTKSFASAFLTAILISGLILVGIVQFSTVQASDVSGPISTNTTWTKAGSPYSLTAPVTVGNGVTLTIEAGVTVNLNGYKIQVNGILYARGNSANNIIFTSAPAGNEGIAFTSDSTSWNEQTSTGCIIENAVLESVSISINSASPKVSNNSITASPEAIVIDSGSPTISKNIIKGDIENLNSASPIISNNSIIGGIYGMGMLTSSPIITYNNVKDGSWRGFGIRCDGINVYVADNIVSNCSTGIKAHDGTSIIERNLVFNNSQGIAIGGMGTISPTIRNNTIANNTVGIYVYLGSASLGSLTIINNNIQENANYSICLANGVTNNIDATYNWWGTTDTQAINQTIYDFKNDSTLGNVTFIPFLTAPNPEALPALGPTYVNGIIGANTTWTAARSPYVITNTVQVPSNVTLTIEAGVTVTTSMNPLSNDYLFLLNGVIIAQGTPDNMITFDGGGLYFFSAGSSKGDSFLNLNYCILKNGSRFWDTKGTSPEGYAHFNLTHSQLENVGNAVSIIYSPEKDVFIEYNTFINSAGFYIWNNASVYIRYNLFNGKNSGLDYLIENWNNGANKTIVQYNSFINIDGIVLSLQSGFPNTGMNGSENFWGTTDINLIRTMIHDNNTDITCAASINYLPILQEPDPNTPTPFFTITASAGAGGSISPSGNVTVAYGDDQTFTVTADSGYQIASVLMDGTPAIAPYTFFDVVADGHTISATFELIPTPTPTPTPTPSPSPSPTPTPTPTPASTQMSISVDASSTAVGSAVNVNGQLSDANGNPLQDKSVTLSYAITGSTSWVPIGSGTTNTAGEYSIQWFNPASGTFTLKAEWNGNDEYLGASATVTRSFLPYENQNLFLFESNSTVSALAFNSTSSELSFTVNGTAETAGYVKVTIAKSLVSNAENIKVFFDGNQLNYELTSSSDADSWLLSFTYQHSTHQVMIGLAANRAGGTLLSIESLAVIAVVVGVAVAGAVGFVVWRKKRKP